MSLMFKSKHKNAGDNILVPTPTFQHFSRVLKYEYSGVFWLLYYSLHSAHSSLHAVWEFTAIDI